MDEVLISEAYLESGFRDRIPSLIAKLSEFLDISPGQLTPLALRALIAIQNLEDLESLVVGVNDVLYSYYVGSLPGVGGKYYLHPRSSNSLVREIQKNDMKRHPISSGEWAERFAFMTLPSFSHI